MTLETKMQKEAMELLDSDRRVSYTEDEYFVYLTLAYYAIRIPKSRFYLNKELLIKRRTNIFKSDNLMCNEKLEISEEMRKINKNNVVLLKCDKFITGINEKYLKLLVRKDCWLYAADEKSAVYFVVNNEIYAVCMPVSLKKEKPIC